MKKTSSGHLRRNGGFLRPLMPGDERPTADPARLPASPGVARVFFV